jgi:hypothetical protein
LDGQLVGRVLQDCGQTLPHGGGLGPGEDDKPGQQALQGMQPDAHGGQHAEVAAATADGPEQVGLVRGVGGNQPAVGQDDPGAEQVVQGQAEAAGKRAVTAGQGQPGQADVTALV